MHIEKLLEPWRSAAESMISQSSVWEAIMGLQRVSKSTRDQGLLPECDLSRDGLVFSVKMAAPEEIEAAHQLFCQHLAANEVEPLSRFRKNLEGVDLSGKRTRYRLFVAVESGTNEIVAAHAGFLISMGKGQAVFVGTYAATRHSHRQFGLMRELFTCSLMQAAIDAHVREEELKLVVGDCTRGSETVWNATGRKRIYVPTKAWTYREVAFMQSSLDFHRDTGLPTAETGAVVEHLMARTFGCSLTKTMLLDAVRAIYRWSSERTQADFDSCAAYEVYRQHFESLLAEFSKSLHSGAGDLALFSAAERAEKEGTEGCIFE
jgi:hypothetical protein